MSGGAQRPQYYIPTAAFALGVLHDEDKTHRLSRGTVRQLGLRAGGSERPGCVRAAPRLVVDLLDVEGIEERAA